MKLKAFPYKAGETNLPDMKDHELFENSLMDEKRGWQINLVAISTCKISMRNSVAFVKVNAMQSATKTKATAWISDPGLR